MSRMMIDCRAVPSDSGLHCWTLHGEPDELLGARRAARRGRPRPRRRSVSCATALRAAMTPAWEPPSAPGAFVQVDRVRHGPIEERPLIEERLVKALGPTRPMRWSILTEDRDRPGTYLAFVEFGSYAACDGQPAVSGHRQLVHRAVGYQHGHARLPQPRRVARASLLMV